MLEKPYAMLEYNRLSVTLKAESVRKSSSLFFALGKSKKMLSSLQQIFFRNLNFRRAVVETLMI